MRRFSRDRARAGPPRTITLKQSFCIWFSGLRGGVAFAIAAASYGDQDFDVRCGGWVRPEGFEEGAGAGAGAGAGVEAPAHCPEDGSDSLAILQTTLLVAVFTILAFGSTARDVAVFSRVLQAR